MLKKITDIIIVMLVVYFVACYGEILIKNVQREPQYSKYNFIVQLSNTESFK